MVAASNEDLWEAAAELAVPEGGEVNSGVLEQKSWPFIIEIADSEHRLRFLNLWHECCKTSGLDVDKDDKAGLLTIRQPRRYTELFASHAGTFYKELRDESAGRSPFRSSIRTSFKNCDDPDFFLPSEAAQLTMMHLESILIDKSAYKVLSGAFRQRRAASFVQIGKPLLNACKALGIVSAEGVFPMHKSSWAAAIWKASRFSVLANPSTYRDYFGDSVGFYVAWMGHYTIWLLLPAVMGLATSSYHILGAKQGRTIEDNPYAPLYALFMILWGAGFTKFWSRQCASLQLQWHGKLADVPSIAGGISRKAAQARRAGFTGTLRQNPVTGEHELYYPPWRRFLKLCVSWSVTALMLGFAFLVMICSLNLQGYVRRVNSILHIQTFHRFAEPGALFDPESMLSFLPGIMHAISIMTLNNLYRMVATMLCEWENHETDEDFEASLLKKRFAFEAFDCYIALFYLAFWECDANLVRNELLALYTVDCLRRVVVEAIIPAVTQWIENQRVKLTTKAHGDNKKSQSASLVAENMSKAEYEEFDDYLEMVIQYGYIVMFAAAFPAAAAISVVYNVIELKSDTFKMCWLYRRPKAVHVNGIGTWKRVIEVQTWLAVFTNLALAGFSSEQLAVWIPAFFVDVADDEISIAEGRGRWVVTTLAAIEHLLIAAMLVIFYLVPDVPTNVRIHAARDEFRMNMAHRARRCRELATSACK